ncbi:peptidyl-tRNA hydrolase PTH2-domain-containing protein [Pelagophyceae sp. CCMP2097]|nr:peptidyl-tRNA hydrolase PTH2-domain-containing protein [Pelagophyceae sp. CCMP2097]
MAAVIDAEAVFGSLLEFGIDPNVAKRAVAANPGSGVDACMEWIFANTAALAGADSGDSEDDDESTDDEEERTKLVIVVRSGLGMSVGKVAAQCCHAALAAQRALVLKDPELAARWEESGEATIVLSSPKSADAAWFEKTQASARAAGLVSESVADAGRTEVEPGTITVLAVGPDFASNVDKITSKLALLK